MTPSEHAREFYGSEFTDTVGLYLSRHYLLSTPTCFAMIKDEGDMWWVEFVAGDLKELICHLPEWRTYLAFNRRLTLQNQALTGKGRYKCYRTEHIVRKILRHDKATIHARAEENLETEGRK